MQFFSLYVIYRLVCRVDLWQNNCLLLAFLRSFLTELPHLQDGFVDKLLELMPRLSSCKPVELVKILQTTLRQSGLLQLRLPEQVH